MPESALRPGVASIRRRAVRLERLVLVDLEAEVAVLEGLSESVLRVGVAAARRLVEQIERLRQVASDVHMVVCCP